MHITDSINCCLYNILAGQALIPDDVMIIFTWHVRKPATNITAVIVCDLELVCSQGRVNSLAPGKF